MTAVLALFFDLTLFLLAIYVAFYIQGNYLLSFSKHKLVYPENFFLPIVTGIIFFTLEAYILSWLHLTAFLLLIPIIMFYLSLKRKLFILPKIPKEQRKVSLLIFIMVVFFSLGMVLNGDIGKSIYFFGDDIAHLAYINELKFTFPPQHPGFAGIPLKGYHFFYDFLIAQISNTFYISPFSLYFHFMPLLTALLWGYGVYTFLYLWMKKISTSLWGVFLLLFGSSFGYLLPLLHHPHSSFTTNFGIDQPETALLNAPFSFSVVLLIAVLTLMQLYYKKRDMLILYFIAIIVGIAPVFKIYAGMILFAGFLFFIVLELIKKNYTVLFPCVVSAGVLCSTFGLFAGSGAGLFYLPLWPIERMFDQLFPDYGYREKITTFTKVGVIKGLALTHLYTFSIFLLGNLGSRLFGILLLPFAYRKKKRMPDKIFWIILTMMIVSVVVPLLFAQTIKVFDMIQMSWYYPLFAAILAAIGFSFISDLSSAKYTRIIIVALIVIVTIPASIANFQAHTLPLLTVKRASLNGDYFNSMSYLKNHGSYTDTVLQVPLGKEYLQKNNVITWYNSTSADIAAFGNKRMYLGNQYITFPNMPTDERLNFLVSINRVEYASSKNQNRTEKLIQSLRERKIFYIYAKHDLQTFSKNKSLPIVFRNNAATIYKVE